MSETLEARAEILKLSRLLGREPDQLAYLEGTPSAELVLLREQVTDVMFTAHGPALSRLATASRLLPVALVATLGEKVFGPVLSARIAGLLDPPRAVDMASRLPVAFLAEVAIELDDGSVQELATAVVEHDLWEPVLIVADSLQDVDLARVAERLADPVAAMDPAEREVIAERARAAGLMVRLGPLRAALEP